MDLSFLEMISGFEGSLNLAAVLDFVDSGRDLILSADVNSSDLIRNIAAECGVDFDEVNVDFIFITIFSRQMFALC